MVMDKRIKRNRLLIESISFGEISNLFVERATISLVREYLCKKGYKETLKTFHKEDKDSQCSGLCNRRATLAKLLQVEALLIENKLQGRSNKEGALKSMLEVLIKTFLIKYLSQTSPLPIKKFKCNNKQTQTPLLSLANTYTEIEIQTEALDLEVDLVKPLLKSVEEEMSQLSSFEECDGGSTGSEVNEDILQVVSSKSSVSKRGPLSRSTSKSKSPSREDDSPSSLVEPLSPPSLPKYQQNFDGEFHIKKPIQQKKGTISPIASDESPVSLAQSLLQTKQNILAHGSLTPAENQKRNKSRTFPSPEESEIKGEDAIFSVKKNNVPIQTVEPVLELCDIEDEDFGYSEEDFEAAVNPPPPLLFIRNSAKIKSQCSQLDLKTWRELKITVLGTNALLQDGWIGQGFVFNSNIPYGLQQNKGGPCGVLAVVQALLLRNLLFCSDYCAKGLPLEKFGKSLKEIPHHLSNSQLNSFSSSSSSAQNWFSLIMSKRSDGLVGAIVEILWKCANNSKGDSGEGRQVKICLQGNEPGTELIIIDKLEELKDFVKENLYRFDCIGLVYSAVLTRGIDRIQEDMDFSSPLLGQHGYCSQELVNLLLFGKCISNAFDNEITLDDKVLHGIKSQSDIGFLSLFEHYGSCEVGSFLKSPKYPVWIVCSESHFSVLFSDEIALVSRDKEQFIQINGFNLFYYDGLAKQQHIIPLTISFKNGATEGGHLSLPKNGFGGGGTQAAAEKPFAEDEHLVAPLEKCIRTKWKNAVVFWNGTEPIL